MEFTDGSCAQIIYTAEGDVAFPKETFRIFASGFVAECENFQKLTLYRGRKATVSFYVRGAAPVDVAVDVVRASDRVAVDFDVTKGVCSSAWPVDLQHVGSLE